MKSLEKNGVRRKPDSHVIKVLPLLKNYTVLFGFTVSMGTMFT